MLSPNQQRFQISYLMDETLLKIDDTDAIAGLSQERKSLPPRYFYDDRGSQLFEAICLLPEYYPTRTEAGILKEYALDIAQITGACELIELGSGSSSKTRILLDAYQQLDYPLVYVPNDVSRSILEESAKEILQDYSNLSIHGLVGTYELALEKLESSPGWKRLICFLGSTLGNFNQGECDRFFSQVTNALSTGDYLLLGIDLQKSPGIIEAAYNDSQGVTAAFNLNMLQHLNQRFRGNFDLNLFEHLAFYHPLKSQIEMHLVSQTEQVVTLAALDFQVEFQAGETILTEISRKFDLETMKGYLEDNNYQVIQEFTDLQRWFGLLLCQLQ
ncbi:L-histidine N(alpha)-methyltransferase [Gloeocapsa sp. PCC 73106]|uniref:L-histidine N(alpha)-methyltransferase n=1 Tax=Gloeocapsa sp. PCC 73106 TaxID=102232 RepID=UPI0002AD0880|nr:L-histidine N(alpha)-methyltransferase [Gloeocapsa sp. PCC 73106]ELR98191.1 putative methyltransferase [Gloeocapsa sp. PCC 73106]